MRIGRGIASLLTLSTRAIRVPTTQMSAPAFIDDVNSKYEVLHKAFEEQFWGTKMALSDGKYNTAELTRTKGEMEGFLADPANLARARELLASGGESLSAEEKKTLELFVKTFGCYIMEGDEAKTLRTACTEVEGSLEAARNKMKLGATLDGAFVELS